MLFSLPPWHSRQGWLRGVLPSKGPGPWAVGAAPPVQHHGASRLPLGLKLHGIENFFLLHLSVSQGGLAGCCVYRH